MKNITKIENILNYTVNSVYFPSSLSPVDSDSINNALVMEQVIGTLVKYGATGRYEPFIASSWQRKNDGKEWTFTFRPHLVDELNESITPYSYQQGLLKVLILLKNKNENKNKNVPPFSNIIGWSQFVATDDPSLLGIRTTDNTITFQFENAPLGLLEFLSMPYFGHFNLENFNPDGSWRGDKSIISSSAYRLAEFNENRLILEKRNWFSHINNSFEKVYILKEKEEIKTGKSIIFQNFGTTTEARPGYKLIQSTPTLLQAFVLSPYKTGPFKNIKNRKIFLNRYLQYIKNEKLNFFPYAFSEHFYPLANNLSRHISSTTEPLQISNDISTINVLIRKSMPETNKVYFKQMLNTLLPELQSKLDFEDADRSQKDWITRSRSNLLFDIKITPVDIGGYPENWVIDMMFCSELGVSFPDPDNKICELVNKYRSKHEIDQFYVNEFNQILFEQASVIPICHSGIVWLFSEDIDTTAFSTTMNMPRFDLLR